MNYRKHYDLLVKKAQNRILDKNIYTETHHIVPRSEGGTDKEDNLVKLLPREHFIAHWLLYRENPTVSRAFAFNMMSCDRRNVYKPSSRAYEEGRQAMAKAQSKSRTGKKVVRDPIAGKDKYIDSIELDYYLELGWKEGRKGNGIGKDRFWVNNGVQEKYVKFLEEGWVKGRLKESNTKDKVAISKDGTVKYVTNPTQYLKEGWIIGNKKHNTPWKKYEGVTLICPHCGKEGGFQGMKRNHFNNCKKITQGED